MKKLIAVLLAIVLLCPITSLTSFAAPKNTTAKNAITVGNEEVADNLPDKKAVRWYKFENKTKGDVVIFLKNTDNIKNIWGVSLFDSTGEKEIGYYRTFTGTSYNISYEALEAGTYYLKFIIGSTYQNESFDNLNYTIRIRTVADVVIPPANGTAHVFTKDGEEMFVLDNRVYSKKGDGTTIVAKGIDHNGDPYIMFVGLTEADLEFYESSSDYTNVPMKYKFIYEDDEKYHYLIMNLYSRELKTDLYLCNGGENTTYAEDNAYELMNLYMGKSANEGKDSLGRELQKDYGPLIIIGIGVVGFFIVIPGVVMLVGFIGSLFGGKKKKRCSSNVISSDYVDNTTTTTTTTSTDELMDMDIAKQVIQNIGGTDGI